MCAYCCRKVPNANACTPGTQKTALHLAVLNKHQAIVKLLLEDGADVMARDLDGLTPSHLAVSNSFLG